MQPTEGFNVPRRALDVEDYIDILRRHGGWILGPFLFCLTAAVVGGYLWPDTYVSKGAIKVEPQQLPTNLVQPIMTQDMWDRINSMLQSIESRATLTNIETTYNLYQKERLRMPPEDVLDMMRSNIKIEPLGPESTTTHNVPAFTVSFAYPDRHQAMKVVQDLMSRFMDANTSIQSNLTFQETEFLKDSTENAQKELDTVETQLAAYKQANNGRLPEQQGENYQKLQALETSAGNLSSTISRLREEKLALEGTLSLYKQQIEDQAKVKPELQQQQQQKSPRRQRAEAEVEAWQNNLRQLQERFKDSYPDVKTAKEELAAAQSRLDSVIKEEADEEAKVKAATGKSIVSPQAFKESQEQQATINRYQIQINTDQDQIDQSQDQLKKVEGQIAAVQAGLNGVPQSEKEYDDLLRERDLKKQQYEEMTKDLAKAQVTRSMEDKKEGEQLEILDPASDPETPASPNHPLVIAVGAGFGLLLGIVIAGAREMKDTSLKNLKDVRAYTQLAILGSIPLLENDFVVRRRRRLAWLGWTTACLASALLMAGSVVYYISTKQ